jgi:hypothetical protein
VRAAVLKVAATEIGFVMVFVPTVIVGEIVIEAEADFDLIVEDCFFVVEAVLKTMQVDFDIADVAEIEVDIDFGTEIAIEANFVEFEVEIEL